MVEQTLVRVQESYTMSSVLAMKPALHSVQWFLHLGVDMAKMQELLAQVDQFSKKA